MGRLGPVLLLLFVAIACFPAFAQSHRFSVVGEHFLLDGKPFIIRSGEMHYPRVPPEHWRDRFRKAKAMGLNAISTYIFWNLHEPTPGKFDFTGGLDIAEFARVAQEEGIYLIIRPGPYVCTEWDLGGLPSWLLRDKDIQIRTKDKRFLAAADRYMQAVGKELAPHQINNGGNIIMVQVENEYGSFGSDHEYMRAIKDSIVRAGFTVPLFTSDGPADYMLKGGTLQDVLSVINFDTNDDPVAQFAKFAKFRTGVPRMIGESYIGWFDHWGEEHHKGEPRVAAAAVDSYLKNDLSFNIYMFHGGWSFGYMAGANYSNSMPYQPDTSDYDYDSPLDAAGRPTPKFYMIRDAIKKYFPNEKIPDVVEDTRFISIPKFELRGAASLADVLKLTKPVSSESPMTMEALGQNYGFVLSRKKLDEDINGKLEFKEQRDYSHVFINGKFVGKLDRRLKEQSIVINAKKGDVLDILVENMGRINYGKEFMFDRKGITESVSFRGQDLKNWQIFSLPFDNPSKLRSSVKASDGSVLFRGSFSLKDVGDTFLDMRGWGKGHVWVNGHHLGRFWNIGPQQSLYLPVGWLKKGRNSIVVLDLENKGFRTIKATPEIIYATKQ